MVGATGTGTGSASLAKLEISRGCCAVAVRFASEGSPDSSCDRSPALGVAATVAGERQMMRVERVVRRRLAPVGVVCAVLLAAATAASAQRLTGTENGEWRYLGGDAGHTRSSPVDQINGDNFSDLEVSWIWRGDNFGPNIDYFNRATPIYVDGVLYTVSSPRRQVVAIEPAT